MVYVSSDVAERIKAVAKSKNIPLRFSKLTMQPPENKNAARYKTVPYGIASTRICTGTTANTSSPRLKLSLAMPIVPDFFDPLNHFLFFGCQVCKSLLSCRRAPRGARGLK